MINIEVKNCWECPYFSFSQYCDMEIGLINCFCNLSDILTNFQKLSINYDTCDEVIHPQCPLKLVNVSVNIGE